jgi:8-oxo-dGTP pyrophosphatase MutT (NUDIX family)
MSFAGHIAFCNSFDPARAVPLLHGEVRLGFVRRDNAEALRRFADVFEVADAAVRLVAPGDMASLSAAVDRVVDALVLERQIPKWRNETFDVAQRWGMPPVFRLDRGAAPFLGIRAYGVHLNGYRRDGGAVRLWIGRRAPDKRVDPDKLDSLVGGGIGNGLGAEATLVKEAEEEAGIAADLIRRAVPAGAVSYRMETPLGIRDDVLFVYDLELPADFVPDNHDGEFVDFALMPVAEVLDRIRATADFKFNVNLVILDFAVRHGLLPPSDPEYLDVATGLHRPLD